MARVDLHVHSKYSNRPTEWLLRRVAAAESYTEPLDVYRRARQRGMDFVTISDHDTIAGALEIAHLPGTFLSCEVTASFPEDGCQIHLLTFGFTEGQFGEIDRLRGNVYELRDYLKREGILHSVAHPLFRVNERLSVAHLEKLLVLFDRFEVRNGIHDAGCEGLVREILSSLTPELAWELAERHRLEFASDRPWQKSFTGGSDDHGGHYLATTWTETPAAADVFAFLAHLRAGRCAPGGAVGSSRRLAHSLHAIAERWHRRRVPRWLLGAGRDPLARVLRELGALGRPPAPRRVWSLPLLARRAAPQLAESDPFARAEAVSRAALGRLAARVERQLARGRFASAVEALAELAPFALAVAPALIAVRAQHKDRDLIARAAARFGVWRDERERVLFLTDDPGELAAPSPAARALAAWTLADGGTFEAASCAAEAGVEPPGVSWVPHRPLAALARIPLGDDTSRTLAVPSLVEVLDRIEGLRPTEVVVSAPGPVGVCALVAAKLARVPVAALVRGDLPAAVFELTREVFLEDLARGLVRAFYGACDRLLVATRFERDRLVADGFAAERIEVVAGDLGGRAAAPAERRAV